MRLVEWRKSEGLTQDELADLFGCTQPVISALERTGNSVPRPDLMLKIYRKTFGAVSPNDFYNLPVLEQLTLPMEERKPRPIAPAPLVDLADAPPARELQRAA